MFEGPKLRVSNEDKVRVGGEKGEVRGNHRCLQSTCSIDIFSGAVSVQHGRTQLVSEATLSACLQFASSKLAGDFNQNTKSRLTSRSCIKVTIISP